MDRRRFATALAAAAASPLLVASAATGAEPENELALWLELARRYSPERLDDEQLTEIARQIASSRATARQLRTFPLTNADAPAPVFFAYRHDGDPPQDGRP